MVDQTVEGPVIQILVEAPTLDLIEDLDEFLARDGLIDETLAAGEALEIPTPVFEFGRYAVFPQLEVLRQVRFERPLGSIERSQVTAHTHFGRRLGQAAYGLTFLGADRAQTSLFLHVYL